MRNKARFYRAAFATVWLFIAIWYLIGAAMSENKSIDEYYYLSLSIFSIGIHTLVVTRR